MPFIKESQNIFKMAIIQFFRGESKKRDTIMKINTFQLGYKY